MGIAPGRPHKASRAVGHIKRAVQSGWEVPLEVGLALERELQQRLFESADAREGISAYLQKPDARVRGAVTADLRYAAGMGIFMRAVITGFGFSLGAALYKETAKRMGWAQEKSPQPAPAGGEAAAATAHAVCCGG